MFIVERVLTVRVTEESSLTGILVGVGAARFLFVLVTGTLLVGFVARLLFQLILPFDDGRW